MRRQLIRLWISQRHCKPCETSSETICDTIMEAVEQEKKVQFVKTDLKINIHLLV